MIDHSDGRFLLTGDGFSYFFRLAAHGQLEQLHFGAPVSIDDAQALSCKPGTGWGTSVLYDRDGTCLDILPLEWSGSGRGDYRESPMILEAGGVPLPTDFRYAGCRVTDGTVQMTGGLPQSHGPGQTLEVTLEQGKLRLFLYWTVLGGVLTRRAVLENGGDSPVTIKKLMSFCLDLPGSFQMTTFDGGWSREMDRSSRPVGPARTVHESTTGFSSFRHQPGFLLSEPGATETAGQVYGFNLVYSGNHYAGAERSLQGLTRVMQGISPDHFSWELGPGERFETPEAVLCWSGEGFGGLSEKLHDYVNQNIVPPAWSYRARPVVFNSWEGCTFHFNQSSLLEQAKIAVKVGCELFVLDDGWFGQRNNDRAGLGDYYVNEQKLPDGLSGLGKRLNDLGLEFGLWFEPEAVNPDSDLYRAHPDWALTDGLPPVYGRNELLLDLTKPEVRDYIVSSVSAVLDSAPISYVKWDMNRHSVALGAKAHAYILGLYEVLRRVFGPRPDILLEGCSAGGNRFDLGMLCFAPQIWCSDNTDPVQRQAIQNNLSYLYPQSTFGAHVSAAPHSQTLRSTPLATRANTAFFGCLGYELDLRRLLPVEEREIWEQTVFYRKNRELFQFGRFRRLETAEGIGWQVSRNGTVLAGLFHRLAPSAPAYERLRLYGLDRNKRYHLHARPQSAWAGKLGALYGLNGLALASVQRIYSVPDGEEDMTASGGALMAGVCLSARYTGTGRDEHTRVQGDFGSTLYLIEEEQ